jgi:hypothetical protein
MSPVWQMAAAIAVVLFVCKPIVVVPREAVVQSGYGYVFDEIVELEVLGKTQCDRPTGRERSRLRGPGSLHAA